MVEKDNELKTYFNILWRNKLMIVGLFVVAVLTAGFVVFRLTPIYETSATIMIKEKDTMSNLFDSSTQMLSSMFGKNKVVTYSKMIKTRTLLSDVITKLDLRDNDGKPLKASDLDQKITVVEVQNTDLIEIAVEHKDPVTAQNIVNALVEEFQNYTKEINQAELSNARQFIEVQLNETQDTLKTAEDELTAYKKATNTILPNEEAKEAINSLTDIEKLATQAKIDLGTAEASLNGIKQGLQLEDQEVISATVESDNPLINQYKGKLADLETQLVGLRAKYTDQHPDIVQVNEQIQKVKDNLKKEVEKSISSTTTTINPIYQSLYQRMVTLETEIIGHRARMEAYSGIIATYEERLKGLPEKELELIRRQRVATISNEIYSMLMTRHKEIQISEAMQISNVIIIDKAVVPEEPVKPNKKMVVIVAGFLALFIGMALAFILEYLDTTVKGAAEVEALLGVPVLGSIPDMRKIKKK